MSDEDDKKKKPIPLRSLMRDVKVPMPAAKVPIGGGGDGKPKWYNNASGTPVGNSPDLERVLALPRRDPLDLNSPRAEALVQLITERYSNGVPPNQGKCDCKSIDHARFKGGVNGCITDVLPIQAWTLFEMGIAGGAIGSIVVGGGKTILNILGVFPLGVDKALVLIPSNLMAQFYDDYLLLAEHFRVPSMNFVGIKGRPGSIKVPGEPTVWALPYGLLSRPGRCDYIDDLKPEAIICDEIDKLADIRGSATARRVLRYYVGAPHTKFAGWTGSLTDKAISEYAHVMVMALKENAPVPLDPQTVEEWGRAINVAEQPEDMGALRAFCSAEELMFEGAKAVRRGYGRRLADTLGIITTSENVVEVYNEQGAIKGSNIEIVFTERPDPVLPPRILQALEDARNYQRPDKLFGAPENDELDSPMEKARTINEVISGIVNVWEFPPTTPDRKKFLDIKDGGVPQEERIVDLWYKHRAPFNKAVRGQVLAAAPFMDSPKLCEEAAARFHGYLEIPPCPPDRNPAEWEARHPLWDCPAYPDWNDIKKQVKPKAVAKRLDPYLVEATAEWALQTKGIVWYSFVEFGTWVAEISGLPLHGGGTHAGRRIKAETGERSIIASIDSHGRGRNGLQFLFDEQLIAQLPSSARRWEQLLGRLIRRGQRSHEVITWIYTHVPELREAIETALRKADYVEDTLRMKQKLIIGWNKKK